MCIKLNVGILLAAHMEEDPQLTGICSSTTDCRLGGLRCWGWRCCDAFGLFLMVTRPLQQSLGIPSCLGLEEGKEEGIASQVLILSKKSKARLISPPRNSCYGLLVKAASCDYERVWKRGYFCSGDGQGRRGMGTALGQPVDRLSTTYKVCSSQVVSETAKNVISMWQMMTIRSMKFEWLPKVT